MADFALAGFAPFCMQSPSFLAHQRHPETGHGRSNCQTLFSMGKIPGDSQIRAKLDAIEPALFHPMFAGLVAELDQCGGLDAMRCLDGHVLIALDGTEFHCSGKIHFLFVRKPDAHKAIEDFRAGIRPGERIDPVRSGKKCVTRRCQWISGVPLRGD